MRSFTLTLLLIATLAVVKVEGGKVRCGPGLPACSRNRCCSAEGYCGVGKNFCRQGCQKEYGRCRPLKPDEPPSNDTPSYPSTPLPTPPKTPPTQPPTIPIPLPPTNVRPPRPQTGVAAKVVTTCSVPGTVAITYDDGPAHTTTALLDTLDRYPDVRVTFYINGLNYVDARLPEYQAVIARAYHSGHQIASHTFQHLDLATLSSDQIVEQMLLNDDVIYSATGRVPRYMRPPYGSYNDQALKVLGDMGYEVTTWNLDTRDWATNDAEESVAAYAELIDMGQADRFISLQHDTVVSSATQLMDMVIPMLREQGFRMVTIAECLGDSRAYL